MFSASRARREAGAVGSSSRRPKMIVSPNTEAVSARVSGVAGGRPPGGGEREVHAVTELVRERQHVAAARGVVEQHVGVHVGTDAQKAPPRLAGRTGASIQRSSKKRRRAAELGREGGVAVEHELARLRARRIRARPRSPAAPCGRSRPGARRRAAGLQPIPATRELVAAADGRDQRRDRLVAGLVGEVARGEPVRVAAKAIVGRLVGEQRVEHECARAQPGASASVTAAAVSRRSSRSGRQEAAERHVERHALASSPSSGDLDRAR